MLICIYFIDLSSTHPIPSPADSLTSWSSPSSSPLQPTYNNFNKYGVSGINNLYSFDALQETSPLGNGGNSVNKNRVNQPPLQIKKTFLRANPTLPTDITNTSFDEHSTSEIPPTHPHSFDHLYLPPTPPATPPDYSNEDVQPVTKTKNVVEVQQTDTIESKPVLSLKTKIYNFDSAQASYSSLTLHSFNQPKISTKSISSAFHQEANFCQQTTTDQSLCCETSTPCISKNSQTTLHQCQECSKVFKTKSNLNQHRNIVHQNVRYMCDDCGKSFTHSGYRYHKLTAHRRNEESVGSSPKDGLQSSEIQVKKFECQKCGKRFAQNSLLRKHVSAVHEQTNDRVGGIRKFQCPYCPSQFKRKDHVDRHITHLHSIVPDAKLFECTYLNCGKRFQSAGRLQQHAKLHQDNATHPCPICRKSILRKKNLSIHMITCHQSEIGKTETETTKENKIKNVKVVNHNDNNNAVKASENVSPTSSDHQHHKVPLKCLACDFTFVYPSKLAAHLSSYPDHCLIPHNHAKYENNFKKCKLTEAQMGKASSEGSDEFNEKDLIIIDDFINALLSNKLNY